MGTPSPIPLLPVCLLDILHANKTLHNLFCVKSWNYAHGIVHCFLLEQILSCPVRTRPDWIDWYFQTIARVKNRSGFRIMAVTMGGTEFLSSLNKTWRQFSQFNLSQRAPKIYPWLRPVAITCERSMCPFQICAYLWIFRLFMKRHFFGTLNWGGG